ncbi:MAG: HlyD family efflux transporter periplasmic adaptor subunit [Bacteroidales bacterium]|nr:MAG: HlyD family efflux transporter periplasmic adaptor subunit [Bacteroidales bacterium]
MNKIYKPSILAFALIGFVLASCNRDGDKADAYGTFETDEITISAESSGKILSFTIEEGDQVKSGQKVGSIDSIQLFLKVKQLTSQIDAIKARIPNINAQSDVQTEQLNVLSIEHDRVKKMFADGAATQKQIDDIEGRLNLAKKQKDAIDVQKTSVFAEIPALNAQVEQIKDQLHRCRIVNPTDGKVLITYVNQFESVVQGKALYKLANMDYMYLRAYISGAQLHSFQTGSKVKVYTDSENDKLIEMEGTITWVSPEAEFTPKIIQTREERVKLVYPIKVKVKNDGSIRIGMPAEVRLINGH